MRSTALLLCAALVAGCSPETEAVAPADGGNESGMVPARDGSGEEGPTPDTAGPEAPGPDLATLDAPPLDAGVDVPAAEDRSPPDVPAPMDVPPPRDLPAPMDLPAPRDLPVDMAMECRLRPPAARPPATAPDESSVPRAVAEEHPDWLRASCVAMGGDSRYLFEVLRRLRSRDERWGLDRSLGPVTGDVVTYFHGEGCPEGRTEVYKIDVIARHCAVPGRDEPPAPSWLDRTPEGGLWTLAGFASPPPPDAGGARDTGGPPDVPTSRPPLPDRSSVVRAVAADRPDLLRASCVERGGNNEFLFEVVRRLRRMDVRWGLNWKRGVVGDLSQDVVDYYFGPAPSPIEGSTDVYIIDIIGGHCGDAPSPGWIDVTEATRLGGTVGRWTLAGRRDLGP